jgi:hypothetical protein
MTSKIVQNWNWPAFEKRRNGMNRQKLVNLDYSYSNRANNRTRKVPKFLTKTGISVEIINFPVGNLKTQNDANKKC